MTVRVRYAPSPTGHLHIGGVRTALFNFLFARHHQGSFILRIEDTDSDRFVPGAEEEMLEGFRWLGMTWDEGPQVGGKYGPYKCTERLDIYRDYLETLKAHHQVYPCFCTPEELEAEREQALVAGAGEALKYSGRCRQLSDGERQRRLDAGEPHSWRFAVPPGQVLALDDVVRGHVEFSTDDMGDFVIVKSDGVPTYNFQVVIDDALMEITHVIRGEEHLSNTPRQLLIYQALGLDQPSFAHLPQVLNENRKKLSKRDGNVLPVDAYRERRYEPQALVNFLALLGWSPGSEEELLSMDELVARFDLARVSRSGAVFDVQKLQWMANQYMKQRDVHELAEGVRQDLERRGIPLPPGCSATWLETLVGLYQEQMACVEEFFELAKGFFSEVITWDEESMAVLNSDSGKQVVHRYLELVESDRGPWNSDASKVRFKQIQKELGVKGRDLYMPVRAAVTGVLHGRDLQVTIACLPREWVVRRIKQSLTAPSNYHGEQ